MYAFILCKITNEGLKKVAIEESKHVIKLTIKNRYVGKISSQLLSKNLLK